MEKSLVNIVILGGGSAGGSVINALFAQAPQFQDVQITLIDKREYHENSIASVRGLVDHPYFEKTAARFVDMYPQAMSSDQVNKGAAVSRLNINVVIGDVRAVLGDKLIVTPSNSEEPLEVPFHFLVVCTGMKYPVFRGAVPLLSERMEEVKRYTDRLRDAQHVLIVGGGIVGVEFAGEIAHAYPTKKVTIVTSGPALLDSNEPHVQRKAAAYLRSKGVNLVFNQRVEAKAQDVPIEGADAANAREQTYTTNTGETIIADYAVFTVGNGTPNTDMLREHFAAALDERGLVKVRRTLQIEGADNIFALGDVIHIPTVGKLAANLKDQAAVVVKNLASLKKAPGAALKSSYTKGMTAPALVLIGPSYAILSFIGVMGWSPNGPKIAKIKNDLFLKLNPSTPYIVQ